MNLQQAYQHLKKALANIEDFDVEDALRVVRKMSEATAAKPITRYTHLDTPAVQAGAIAAAHDLATAQKNFQDYTETAKTLTDGDFQMTALRDELALYENKVKDIKGRIRQRETELIPLVVQEALAEAEADVDMTRDILGDHLSELYDRFPNLEASDLGLGFIENDNGEIFKVMVNRSAEAGWEVDDILAFAMTLPKSHTDLFKVSLVANSKKINRALINDWLEVQHMTGVLRGVVRKPRTIVTVADKGGLFTLQKVEGEEKPASLVKLNW